jgi:hypothetical protein
MRPVFSACPASCLNMLSDQRQKICIYQVLSSIIEEWNSANSQSSVHKTGGHSSGFPLFQFSLKQYQNKITRSIWLKFVSFNREILKGKAWIFSAKSARLHSTVYKIPCRHFASSYCPIGKSIRPM